MDFLCYLAGTLAVHGHKLGQNLSKITKLIQLITVIWGEGNLWEGICGATGIEKDCSSVSRADVELGS